MERWLHRVALVTGASEGIGRALAVLLANHGMKVIGCARNLSRVQEAAAAVDSATGCIEAVQCDISDEAAVMAMFEGIRAKHGRLDVCVNNAGVGFSTSLLEASANELRTMTDVNMIGLCVCTREAVKLMREANIDDGHIVHISSMSGYRVVPGTKMGFYSATKHAVRALTEALRLELRDIKSNIRVSEVSPGLVKTEFMARSGSGATYEGRPVLSAEDVAEAVKYILAAPAHVQVHDVLMRPTQQYS